MELIGILSAFMVAALASFSLRNRVIIETVSIAASCVALITSLLVGLRVATFGTYSPTMLLAVDSLGAIMLMIIGGIGCAVAVYSVQFLRQETRKNNLEFSKVKRYFVLLNIFLAAMFLAIMASSPVLAWISIEATTLSTVFLISFYNRPSAVEAAWKYLIINSVGLLLGFFGTLLFFVSAPDGNAFVSWQSLSNTVTHSDPLIIKIAFIFVLIGYGTKIGLAPMHTWLPDAHSKAPAPISALLSGVLLNVAFVTMLRFKAIADISVGVDFSRELLIAFGFLSIFIAAFINFNQKNYKRLLAYHSIENMGIATLGFGFGGVGVVAAILHMIYHAFVKAALFLSAGTILLKYGSTKIKNIRGTLIALPVTSILFLLGFFIITGTPPFGMFVTKVLIFSAGISAHPYVTIASLFSAALLFVAFFNHATEMFFGDKPDGIQAGEDSIWLIIPPLVLIGVVVALSFSIPSFLNTLINTASLHY